jgi:L-iditol 2-dehydrogenase
MATTKTGLASVVTEYREPLEIVEYPVPEPEPGALVVRVDVATMCGSDVHTWEGAYVGVLPVEPPLILGHEVVGIVEKIGSGAQLDSVGRPVRVGDRVVWAHEPCGHCRLCSVDREPTLCPNRRIGMMETSARAPHFSGTFAEYSYVWPNSGRIRVPDDLKSEWASAASCALRTVINGVERAGQIDYRHNVVVQGAGPVGLFCAAVLATHSPAQIIVIGAPDARLDVARAFGADHTISITEHPDPQERLELVNQLTDGRGPDVMFEASGGRGAVAEGVAMVAANGRYVLIGSVGGPPQEVPVGRIVTRGLTVSGSFGGDIDSYYKAMEFMRCTRSRFDFDLVLGERYGLGDVTDALQKMQRFEDIKPVIVPGGLS